nr:TonB family protein [Pedobacter sp. MC2016-14]
MADLARKDSIIYNAEALNEVVVIGYGVQKKTSITGSVSTIDTSLKAKATLQDALVGRLAGISVSKSKRERSEAKPLKKDAENSIRIRGMSTLTGDQKPLFIVDGMPYNGDINALDPKVISSFEVLKDASATALYGSRAANGVIIITTTNTLNEVVVAAHGAVKKQKPEPLVGWKVYEHYLEKEATLGDKSKGKVTLTFTLGPEGKPLNLKVVKSDGDAMSKKAIELITNGSKWHPGKGMNDKEIKLKVKFH